MRNKVLPGLAKHVKPITVTQAKLAPGVTAEAVDSNRIIISEDIPKDSELYRRAVAHESHHAKEMRNGTIAYGDDWVRDGDQFFPRKNGHIKQDGAWKMEGSNKLPWERRAIKAEKDV